MIRRRRLLKTARWFSAAFLSVALGSVATAQETIPPQNFRKPIKEPIEITAERLVHLREEDRYIADGAVRIVQGDTELRADHVEMDNRTGRVEAAGNVTLREGGDVLTADRLDYNLRTRVGDASPGHLFVKKDNTYLDAGRMGKVSDQRYELKDWSATNCIPCEDSPSAAPLWRFRGRSARADLGEYLVARDVVFYVKDVPVLYTPYLIFPIKTERQTGFLIPRLGYSTADGLRLNEAFFWAIGPSHDATISLDYRSLRGVGAGVEYRYKLSRESEGHLQYRVFDDRITESRRTETEFRHTQRFSPDFQARADLHLVSDISQFRDLSDATSERVRQNLVSTFVVFHRWDNQEIYLMARLTRDLVSSTSTTLQRLPQIGYSLREYRLGMLPIYAGLDATAVNFWREEEDEADGLIRARRLDFFPRIWTRLNLGGVVVTPRAGFRETWYSRDLESDPSTSRGVEVLDIAANTRLTRIFGPSDHREIIHHIEPAVVYEYVPFVDQARLPHFDDVDQVPRQNQFTVSLANRLVGIDASASEAPSRREWIYWKLTQSYDLHAKRIEEDPGPARPFSNVRSETILRPAERLVLDLDVFYNLYEKDTIAFNSDLKAALPVFSTIAIGQRLTREGTPSPRGDLFNPISQTDRLFWYTETSPLVRFLTGELKIHPPGPITLSSRAYYDVKDRTFAEINYGIRYVGQCLGVELTYQDLPDRNQFSFLITLRPSEMSRSSFVNF